MGLVPAKQINFDGAGLSASDDYTNDASGVGHFHPIKAGSTWRFDLKFVGVDTEALSWAMQVRTSYAAASTILDSAGSGSTQITVTPNPTGLDNTVVRFAVTAAGTALLQSSGAGTSFVYDIEAASGAERDRMVYGTGIVTPEVTR